MNQVSYHLTISCYCKLLSYLLLSYYHVSYYHMGYSILRIILQNKLCQFYSLSVYVIKNIEETCRKEIFSATLITPILQTASLMNNILTT